MKEPTLKWVQSGKFAAVLGAAIVSLLLACREAPRLGAEAVRQALDGRQFILPALSGLSRADNCRMTPGFIPKTRCGEGLNDINSRDLRTLAAGLNQRMAASPNSDELHGAAILRLALGNSTEKDLVTAIGRLREALGDELSPVRRAALLSDLAAANLLLAEELQSSLEAAAALEAAFMALDYDPGNKAARFNQSLALLLLGVHRAEQVSNNPTLANVSNSLRPLELTNSSDAAPEGEAPSVGNCLSAPQIRSALDTWVLERTVENWAPLGEEFVCSEDAADRFFPDLLAAASSDPDRFAEAWANYLGLEAGFSAFDPSVVRDSLSRVAGARTPEPIRLAADYFAALLPMTAGHYEESRRLLERHLRDVEAQSYTGLQAKALIGLALVAQLRGEFGSALAWQRQAEVAARQSGVDVLITKARSQRTELESLGGREYDAWRSQTLALRGFSADSKSEFFISALGIFANLARDRDFERVALYLQDQAVAAAKTRGLGTRIAALRARGEARIRLGRLEGARGDLARARHLLGQGSEELLSRDHLNADISWLEGLIASDSATRKTALEVALGYYRAVDYDRRILKVQHALATVQRDAGEAEAALATLEAAFDELEEQVASSATWSDATALVASARPLADLLVELQLDHRRSVDVVETLGRYLGLRSQFQDDAEKVGQVAGARLTTFVRESEVILLLESSTPLTVFRQPVDRQRLSALRAQVLLLASSQAHPARLQTALDRLATLLLKPWIERLKPGTRLVVVADDVLAGLPFHLFPIGREGEILLDRHAVVYGVDLSTPAAEQAPAHILAVGAHGAGSGHERLVQAEGEARGVAEAYSWDLKLLGSDATPVTMRSRLLTADTTVDAVHVASHFEVNTRWPLDSSLVLNDGASIDAEETGARYRLTLRELLAHTPDGLKLLYLSACDSGVSLPLEAHGLHSLAQAFVSSGIERSVIALWPLDDAVGAAIAVRFHHLFAAGTPAAEALRVAQLEHRGKHPALWGALALYQ